MGCITWVKLRAPLKPKTIISFILKYCIYYIENALLFRRKINGLRNDIIIEILFLLFDRVKLLERESTDAGVMPCDITT